MAKPKTIPRRDDVLDEYAMAGPSLVRLQEWIRRYPWFKEDLMLLTADWALFEWPEDEESLEHTTKEDPAVQQGLVKHGHKLVDEYQPNPSRRARHEREPQRAHPWPPILSQKRFWRLSVAATMVGVAIVALFVIQNLISVGSAQTETLAFDPYQPRVEDHIQVLVHAPERGIYQSLSLSATYFPMFEQILHEEKVPDELKYLAVTKSQLDPRKMSRSGAAGLWQLMPETGRAYGLRRTNIIDQRFDPEKSTQAAASYLKELHLEFDDWLLAVAAYTGKPEEVRDALRQVDHVKNRPVTYWDISPKLPSKTRNVTSRFVAMVLVASNLPKYGLELPAPAPPYAYDQGSGRLDAGIPCRASR